MGTRRIGVAGAAVVAVALTASGTVALPQVPSPTVPSPTVPAAVGDPCPIPYIVGEQLSGGELSARFGLAAIKRLSKLPNLEARAGREVLRTAYAGVSSQAMAAVLDAYGCRIRAYLARTGAADAAAKMTAVEAAIAQLKGHMAVVQNAAQQPAPALGEVQQTLFAMTQRPDGAPTVDRAVLSAALADVDPERLFLSVEERRRWAGLQFGPIVDVSACGGVIKAAISDGGSSLQRGLADVKVILINYLDKNTSPIVALSQLFVDASATPPMTTAAINATSFRNCSADVARHPVPAEAPIAAVTPVAPTATASPSPTSSPSPTPSPSPAASPTPSASPTPVAALRVGTPRGVG